MVLDRLLETRRPRVLLACSGVGHVLRGYERVTCELAVRLRPILDARLVRGGGPWLNTPGIRLPCLHRGGALTARITSNPQVAYWLEQNTFSAPLYPLARALDADWVHIHDPAVMNALWHARQRLGGRFRILFTNGGLLSPEHLHRADRVHVLSPVDEARLLAAGFPRTQVAFLPYGIDLPSTPLCPSERGPLRIVSVGVLTLEKGVDVTIRAAAAIPDAQLTLLGQRAQDTPVHEALLAELLGPRGQMLTLAPSDVEGHLRRASVFVLPTRSEGFGMAVLEAMAIGLPVVVGDVPVLRWLVGDAGILVPPGDVAGFTHALLSLTPDRSIALGRAARLRAEAFSWNALGPKLASLYA